MKKKSGVIIVFILILISVIALTYYNNNSEIKIGVILPLTGPVAEPGNNALTGIQLAINNYNNSNNTKKIKLLIENSKSNPKDGVSAINKLIFTDHCKVIIGDIMSSVFLACAPIAEKNKVVMISPGASNPKVSTAGEYIFRDYLSDNFDGKVMSNYLFQDKNINNVAVLSVNNDYGLGVKNTFVNDFKKLGGNIVFNEDYKQGENNFRSILTKLKNKKFDAIYIISNPTENGYIVKQMKELNIKTKIFGNLSFENNEFIKIAKGSFDYIEFSAPYFNLKEKNPVVQDFYKSYFNTYNKKPDVAAALGYDVALILIKVLKKTNYNISQLKDALYKIKDFNGVTGKTTFDSNGDVLKDIYIKKIDSLGNISIINKYNIE